MITCGAIDLGGTKIEARTFDVDMQTIATKRTATPIDSFDDFMEGLCAQVDWLFTQAGNRVLPVGIALPGVINPTTGIASAANIPISGHNVGEVLEKRFGRKFYLGNDCMALAYSETHGGAGDRYESVVGLVLGTGVGAGICLNGEIPARNSGLAVEVGHLGMPAQVLAEHSVPIWSCGDGKIGRMECYAAGSAVTRLYEWKTGENIDGREVVERMQKGEPAAKAVVSLWEGFVAECLLALQLMLDPSCIVLGGGASMIPGLTARLTEELKKRQLGTSGQPDIFLAQHGDSSGARGMALLAMSHEV